MRLVDLIAEVRDQGYSIVYSSDLVHGGLRVDAGDASLASLQRVLPALGLRLERKGDILLIEPGPRVQPETTPEPVEGPENIIVTGSRHRFPEASAGSARRITAREMASTPSLASDWMRSTLRLPGVSSVGISAKPHIRGGLKDELLILQDGVELLEPFHLADYHSAYSALDFFSVESVDVYTGGFPPRYGNRMSGVMDINNDWKREYRTHLGVSSFASYIDTRQPLPGGTDGDWGMSYRWGDLSDLTDYIDSRVGDPEYQDASLRLRLSPADDLQLDSGLVYSEDDIEFSDIGERALSHIDSWYGWLRLHHTPDTRSSNRLTLSAVEFDRTKRQGNAEIEDDPADPGSFLDFEQTIRRLGLRNDLRRVRDGVIHELGWQLEYSDGEYDNLSRIDRGDLADIIGTERMVARDIHLSPDGWSGGAYWAGEWEIGEHWLLQPGLRWDWQDYYLERGADHQLSPRLGVVYRVSDKLRWRLSAGRFYQPEGIQELQVLDGLTRFFRPQRSDQVVAGLEWGDARRQLVFEAWLKSYDNTKGRFENIFNPFVLLPEMESDRLQLTPDRARARGVDLEFRQEITQALVGQLRYSYLTAEDRLEKRWTERRWSQEHTVNTSLVWQRENFSLAAAALWHSGWRSTRLPGYVPADVEIDPLDFLNNTELREYFSIDLSARYRWTFPRCRIEVYADISNLTDRSNQAGIDYDEEEVAGGFLLAPDRESLLDRVTSVGITLSF